MSDPDADEVRESAEREAVEREAAKIRKDAQALFARARIFEIAGAVALGALSASGAYVTDRLLDSLSRMSAWNKAAPPTPWPPVAAFFVGAVVGWALARPFADWLRLQARLAEVHLRSEDWMRKAGEHTEETARGIRALGTATATFATLDLKTIGEEKEPLRPFKGGP